MNIQNENQKIYAFSLGWGNIRHRDADACKAEIKQALGIKCDQAFRNRKKGLNMLTKTQYDEIERIFSKYGVTEVWGL